MQESDVMTTVMKKNKLSVRTQSLAALSAIIGAVALPQLFHAMGAVSGLGTIPGEVFLPMHLPIILVGLLAGPYAGAVSGLIAPLLSFAVTGMPTSSMLLFMMIELCIYGLCAGLLRGTDIPTVFKVVIAQLAGRLVRAGAILFAVYALGSTAIGTGVILSSIAKGIPGLALQLVLIPLIVYRVENAGSHEKSE